MSKQSFDQPPMGRTSIQSTHSSSPSSSSSTHKHDLPRFQNTAVGAGDAPIPEEYQDLKRGLKARHLSMIAIAGTIGTGLFLASGSSIANAGPLGALIAYTLTGSMVYFLMTSLGEMATLIPTAGSFNTYAGRFIDPALGFALGVNYFLNWAITVAVEIIACGMIMGYWVSPDVVPSWAWALIFLVLMVAINLMPVKGYGEAEYWFSIIKILTVIIFIIVGILVDAGVLGGDKIGFRNWTYGDAPIVNGFAGILSVFLVAGFSFQGTELLGVAAGESEDPRKNVPKAVKQVFWRILLFYIISIFIIGLVIPYDDPNLLASGSVDTVAISPFTLVLQKAFKPAADIMNGIILITVISAGNSGMYASTRTLCMLSRDGKAPAIFGKISKHGIPLWSLAATTLVASLSFVTSLFGSGQVYMWLLNLSSISGFIAWLGIAASHYRFRKAYVAQGGDVSRLPYTAAWYPFGPIYALILCTIVIVGQGYSEFTSDDPSALNLIACYIGIPFFIAFYLGYKFYYKTKVVNLMDCDFSTAGLDDGLVDDVQELYEPAQNQVDQKHR